jgi:6-phosphogluconolactonase
VNRDLVVTDDLVGEAVRLFLERAPRTICLSGGATPRSVYEGLAGAPFDWSVTEVFFGDERCVPQTHPDSNFRMASEALLARVPATVYPMPGATCDAEGYERKLRERFGDVPWPRFDLAFLGLGEDGHTASLFPGQPALEVADRWAVRVPQPGQPPRHPRITLTLPVLSASALGIFLVSGASKRDALRRLREGDREIPAARVTPDRLVILATPDATG